MAGRSQLRSVEDLADPMAVHYVLGVEHRLAEDTRLTVEAYYKDYRHFPRDPTQPSFFVIDELFYLLPIFGLEFEF